MIKLTVLILLAALVLPLMADDIVVKEIGGVPVIRTKIHYGDKEIEASILIDLGSNTPMVIHERSFLLLYLTSYLRNCRPVSRAIAEGVG
jgi:hypothetical protein